MQVLLTLVNVFIGWKRVAACVYLGLSLWLLWQYLRWVRYTSIAGRLYSVRMAQACIPTLEPLMSNKVAAFNAHAWARICSQG